MKKPPRNRTNVVDLISKIQEQLISLEGKMDILLKASLAKPPEARPAFKPFSQPAVMPGQGQGRAQAQTQHQAQSSHYRQRIMHKAICADCHKGCEVPFRPSGNRPVYCQACFSRRKAGNSFKANPNHRPNQAIPAPPATSNKPQAVEKKKPAARFKKKPLPKKKKSKR